MSQQIICSVNVNYKVAMVDLSLFELQPFICAPAISIPKALAGRRAISVSSLRFVSSNASVFALLTKSSQRLHYLSGQKDSFLQLCLNRFYLHLKRESEKSLTNSNQSGATALFEPLLPGSHLHILVDIMSIEL